MKKILISFFLLVTTYGLDASLNQVSQKQYVLPESIIRLIDKRPYDGKSLWIPENIYYEEPIRKLKLYGYSDEEIRVIITALRGQLPSVDDLGFYLGMLKVFDFLQDEYKKTSAIQSQKIDLQKIFYYISTSFKEKVDSDQKSVIP